MPQRKLDERYCATRKAADGAAQTDYFDAETTGLALRVFKSGAKSWMYRFSWGGKRKWMMLGTYPATSIKSARTRADEARTALEAGKDPRTALAKPETLRAICEEWAHREAGGLRTGADRKAALERHVYPVLGDLPVSDIRRSDIVRMLDRIADRQSGGRRKGGPVAADRALAIIRSVFNWYAIRHDDFHSPIVRGMSRSKPSERARARILTDDEIRTVWRTAEGQGAFGRLIRFLLLTGARRSEAAGMKWTELDLSTGAGTDTTVGAAVDWTLPGARNKTKLELIRPLPPLAVAQLPTQSGPRGPFVFSNNGGHNQVRGYGPLKEAFDKATGPMEAWRLHDLRRTVRSLMSRAGVPTDHAERVLGHVIGGVRGTYDRHEYHEEKKAALAALARLISNIVAPRPKVLTLRKVER